jgi:hypothetical protein
MFTLTNIALCLGLVLGLGLFMNGYLKGKKVLSKLSQKKPY